MTKYENFGKAREFSRKLKIKCAREWREYASSEKRPANIPSHPDRQYKNCGWVNWMDWLDTDNKQNGNRIYVVNDNYFKEWSSDMAYILGFWFTDGYMNEKLGTFSVTQHKKDKYILENILKKMGSDSILYRHGNNSFDFKITSHEIVKDIKKYGGFQRKSYNIKFPKMIPQKYLSDFIRGLWDGDGCVCFQKSQKCYVSSFVSASKDFVCDLLDLLRKEIRGFKGTINPYHNVYVLNVGVNDTRRLRGYLYKNIYDNSLFLQRKYEKFKLSGEIRIALQNIEFVSYEDASEFVRNLGIKTHKEWKRYKKNNGIIDIPSNPDTTYKNKGWIGWETFVGTTFWDYEKAKEYVRSLGLSGAREWKQYSSSEKRPYNIPSNPWSVYKEWNGLADWLGENKT